jgi:protein TonB
MTQLALGPDSAPDSTTRPTATSSWLSPALLGALLLSVSFHAVPVGRAIRDLAEMRVFIHAARDRLHDYMWTTYEVEAPPPPPKPVDKPPEPEPEPEPAPMPAPKPAAQAPVAKDNKPAPPPAAAQAGKTIVDDKTPVDFTDFTMVQGDGRYAGGTTASKGTSDTAVNDLRARGGGSPGGAGSTPGAAPAPPPKDEGPDRSRAASPANKEWSCSHLFPAEADSDGIDNASVSIVVTVRADGTAQSVKILSDPGHGFGRAARICALSQRYNPAFDRSGTAIVSTTAPIPVRFTR